MSKKNIGSSFDDFLQEESLLESTTAVALKRVIAWQIDQEMKAQKLTKTALPKVCIHELTHIKSYPGGV